MNTPDTTMYDKYEVELQMQLNNLCTSNEWLPVPILSTDDIEEKWADLAPEYLADAAREYNTYPLSALAWASYIGMAVAKWWDTDWENNRYRTYMSLKGSRGFDNMDEHIITDILHYKLEGVEHNNIDAVLRQCATAANDRLRHESVEPGTVDAFYLFTRTVRVMYRIGAALGLAQLGYKMESTDLS